MIAAKPPLQIPLCTLLFNITISNTPVKYLSLLHTSLTAAQEKNKTFFNAPSRSNPPVLMVSLFKIADSTMKLCLGVCKLPHATLYQSTLTFLFFFFYGRKSTLTCFSLM